jgi:hypothetical protein
MVVCRSRMQTRCSKYASRMPAAKPDMPAPMMIVSYMAKAIQAGKEREPGERPWDVGRRKRHAAITPLGGLLTGPS